MERIRDRKVCFAESATNIPKTSPAERRRPKPRSRSTHTSSSHSEASLRGGGRDLRHYESVRWLPRPPSLKDSGFMRSYDPWYDGFIGGTSITSQGIITMRLHDRVKVDIALDRAIRLINLRSSIVLSLSASGSTAALIHPNGRVYQYGSRVEIMANDQEGNNKYAKMWYKGVSFTSDHCALVYLVDSAGTRTTTDCFTDLSVDFSLTVFYNDYHFTEVTSRSSSPIADAIAHIQSANYWMTEEGTENWTINGVRISQTSDGLVRIGRSNSKFLMRTSPSNGSASMTTPFVHCTGSMGQTRHLFVRRGERRMHYDGSSFIVRNAGHSAGFDDKHQLKVY